MYSVVLMMALTSGAETPVLFKRGCSGCSGACAGSSYGSCSGSCHGGRRKLFGGRKHGCHGCNGGCSGYSSCCGAVASCSGACYGAGAGCGGVAPMVAPPPVKPPVKPPEKVKKPPEEKEETLAPAPATILVSLPAEAKLTVDGVATTSTSASRSFVTPVLENGKTYFYTLKAEIVREGKAVTVAKQVEVRAGEASQVSFEIAESVASK
jgi:uncharacterized protein (TIGR03000 family)